MFLEFFGTLGFFFTVTHGLAWPLVARLKLDPAEKIVATAVLSLVAVFLATWAIYIWALSTALLWALPVLALLGVALNFRAMAETWRDPDARAIVAGQALVTGWCLGWLALVVNYSGGGWVGDCYEHWERTCFFTLHWPLDHLFLGYYPLTARPPFTNIVTAAFVALTRIDFAHYQIIMTLLSSLAFLPATLLTRRFGGGKSAVAVLALLFMVSPLFVQNATFTWTKLPAAFFVLAALYFLLRAQAPGDSRAAAILGVASLAAGLLSHYSSGPYAVLLALAWFGLGWPKRHDADWRRTTALAAGVGAAMLATWFVWSFSIYGTRSTLFANSTFAEQAPSLAAQCGRILLNLRDTLVPHFLRPLDTSLIAQLSIWGTWRDWWFQLYQLNLFFAFGSVAWLALLALLGGEWRRARFSARAFWGWFVAGAFLLGVGVHGARDTWGLMHICLQPLVLLGLSLLAARWEALSRGWKLLLIAGATCDLCLGITLHFAVQNFFFDRWLTPDRAPILWFNSYSMGARMNLSAKLRNGWNFLGDTVSPALPAVLLVAIILLALRRAPRADQAVKSR